MLTRYTFVPTPIGSLLAVSRGAGLRGLYFPSHRRGPEVDGSWVADPTPFRPVITALGDYFSGRSSTFDVDLDLRGSVFQLEVWAALQRIPVGRTTSYGELARGLGRRGSARAVASAVARNPVGIIVPCHRVVPADGSLGGFAGGVDRKRQLLELEGADVVATAGATRG